jgi:hypothetical protein
VRVLPKRRIALEPAYGSRHDNSPEVGCTAGNRFARSDPSSRCRLRGVHKRPLGSRPGREEVLARPPCKPSPPICSEVPSEMGGGSLNFAGLDLARTFILNGCCAAVGAPPVQAMQFQAFCKTPDQRAPKDWELLGNSRRCTRNGPASVAGQASIRRLRLLTRSEL